MAIWLTLPFWYPRLWEKKKTCPFAALENSSRMLFQLAARQIIIFRIQALVAAQNFLMTRWRECLGSQVKLFKAFLASSKPKSGPWKLSLLTNISPFFWRAPMLKNRFLFVWQSVSILIALIVAQNWESTTPKIPWMHYIWLFLTWQESWSRISWVFHFKPSERRWEFLTYKSCSYTLLRPIRPRIEKAWLIKGCTQTSLLSKWNSLLQWGFVFILGSRQRASYASSIIPRVALLSSASPFWIVPLPRSEEETAER